MSMLAIYLLGLIPAFLLFLIPAFFISKRDYSTGEVLLNTFIWPVMVFVILPITVLWATIDYLRS